MQYIYKIVSEDYIEGGWIQFDFCSDQKLDRIGSVELRCNLKKIKIKIKKSSALGGTPHNKLNKMGYHRSHSLRPRIFQLLF
jgi:hypothetical protein